MHSNADVGAATATTAEACGGETCVVGMVVHSSELCGLSPAFDSGRLPWGERRGDDVGEATALAVKLAPMTTRGFTPTSVLRSQLA